MPAEREKENDSFMDTVLGMADTLGLENEDRQRYVHEHMTRAGFKMVPSYIKDDGEDDRGDDFFGSGKKRGRESGSGRGNSERRGNSWF